MNEMRKLMESIEKINENYGGGHYNAPDVRKMTNKLHEMMDEQMLDPRAVADAALKYMSEDDVADMARINELIYDDDDFDESVEILGEAKWDYKQKDKGRGAGTDSPMYDGGAKNRKSRKAFRKAEKAKAHAARMSGQQIDEGPEGYNEMEEIANELEEIKENIADLMHQAASLVDSTDQAGAARAYWIGHILGALDNESEYMGGSMTTMQDSIDAIREDEDGYDEEDDGSWEAAERANR